MGNLINNKTPTELKAINRSALRAMGVSANDTERFVENSAFSPTQQTALTLELKELEGVENRGAFVHVAGQKSSNEADALFCVQTAMLMSQIHSSEHPLARIVMLENFPVGVGKDGMVVVALQWDYAAWTSRAAAFTSQIQELANQFGNKGVLVALSGDASPRLKQELEARHFTVRDRLSPGPLK